MLNYFFLIGIVFMIVFIVKKVFQLEQQNFIIVSTLIGIIIFIAYNSQNLESSVILGACTGLMSCATIQFKSLYHKQHQYKR